MFIIGRQCTSETDRELVMLFATPDEAKAKKAVEDLQIQYILAREVKSPHLPRGINSETAEFAKYRVDCAEYDRKIREIMTLDPPLYGAIGFLRMDWEYSYEEVKDLD